MNLKEYLKDQKKKIVIECEEIGTGPLDFVYYVKDKNFDGTTEFDNKPISYEMFVEIVNLIREIPCPNSNTKQKYTQTVA